MVCFVFVGPGRKPAPAGAARARIGTASASGGAFVICADSGADALPSGVIPDLAIGDMDSISDNAKARLASLGVRFETFPTRKDHTDLHLALLAAERLSPREIVVFGGLTGRVDQTVSNIFTAGCRQMETGTPVSIHDGRSHVYFACAPLTRELSVSYRVSPGDTVSLRPLLADVRVEWSEGLEYPVSDDVISAGESRGTSNSSPGDSFGVKVASGGLVVMHLERLRSSNGARSR